MQAKRYQRRAFYIDAIQWTGTNVQDISDFVDTECLSLECEYPTEVPKLAIRTLDGDEIVNKMDYVIKGKDGKFYSISPDNFKFLFEEVINAT